MRMSLDFGAFALLAGVVLGPGAVRAEAPVVSAPAAQLTFERVFASPSLAGAAPRGVKLSPDGRWVTLLRGRAEDRARQDLWGFDRKTGKWRMLVDSVRLSGGHALSEAEKMQRERQRIGDLTGIVSYEWSADSKALLVPLDGELLRVTLDGAVQRVGGGAHDALNPTLSPKGHALSFVREARLWVAPVGDGVAGDGVAGRAPRAITPDEGVGSVHWNLSRKRRWGARSAIGGRPTTRGLR